MIRSQCSCGFSSPLKIKNVNDPFIVNTLYDRMKDYVRYCVIGLVPPFKKTKHVFARVVVFINTKARARRVIHLQSWCSMSVDTEV